MNIGRPWVRLLSLLILLLASVSVALAQGYESYQRGLTLEQESRWEDAIRAFRASAREHPVPQKQVVTPANRTIVDYDPYFHIATCLAELDRNKEAGMELMRSYRAGVTPRDRIDSLAGRLRQAGPNRRGFPRPPLPRKLAMLAVSSEPTGAQVTVNGQPFGMTPTGRKTVDPGEHEVRIVSPGFAPLIKRAIVDGGQTVELSVTLTMLPRTEVKPTSTPAIFANTTPTPATFLANTTPMISPPPPTLATTTPTPAFQALAIPESQPAGKRRTLIAIVCLVAGAFAIAAFTFFKKRREKRTPTAATRHLDQAATLVGTAGSLNFTGYDVIDTLGRGGMATTYRATRNRDNTQVALKVPHESCIADASFITRFVREGKLGEQLHHPRIVRIFEAGEEGGRPFLAMELLAGHTLKQELREKGPLPLRRAVEIARDIAEALDYAHLKGVVHRDLKPDNVMILPDGAVKVMDFGIARVASQPGLTNTNIFMGTPLYAAPEMIDPKTIDHRVDLYALGIILFEMIEGNVPFDADSPYRVIEMHLRQPLPSREELKRHVPDALWVVVAKLCEKEPAKRYQNAESLLVELQRLAQNLPELGGSDVLS